MCKSAVFQMRARILSSWDAAEWRQTVHIGEGLLKACGVCAWQVFLVAWGRVQPLLTVSRISLI
jgi:hypothetical protein